MTDSMGPENLVRHMQKSVVQWSVISRTWFWHVKAYFQGQAWMTDHETCTHSHLPHSYNLQILLARGNGASTNVEPCYICNSLHTPTLGYVATVLCNEVVHLVPYLHKRGLYMQPEIYITYVNYITDLSFVDMPTPAYSVPYLR